MENFSEFNGQATAPQKSAGEIISHAFEKYTGAIGFVLLAVLIYIIASAIVGPVTGFDSREFVEEMKNANGNFEHINFNEIPGIKFYYGLSGILSFLFAPIYVGLIYIFNKKNYGQKIDAADLFIGYKQNFVNILLYTIISHVILGISALFCVIPILFVAPLLLLGYPILLFENASFSDALTKSFNIAKENYGIFLGTTLLGILISASGIVLCFVGILLTMYFYLAVSYSAYCAFCGTPRQIEQKS